MVISSCKIVLEDTHNIIHTYVRIHTHLNYICTYNRVLYSPDSFSPTIMKLGLCPHEKGSGVTRYQIVVIYSTATMLRITSMSSPIHKQNAGSFCRNVEIVIFCQSFTFNYGLQNLFTRTKSQFQHQKGEWVWSMERYTQYWISD